MSNDFYSSLAGEDSNKAIMPPSQSAREHFDGYLEQRAGEYELLVNDLSLVKNNTLVVMLATVISAKPNSTVGRVFTDSQGLTATHSTETWAVGDTIKVMYNLSKQYTDDKLRRLIKALECGQEDQIWLKEPILGPTGKVITDQNGEQAPNWPLVLKAHLEEGRSTGKLVRADVYVSAKTADNMKTKPAYKPGEFRVFASTQFRDIPADAQAARMAELAEALEE